MYTTPTEPKDLKKRVEKTIGSREVFGYFKMDIIRVTEVLLRTELGSRNLDSHSLML